MGRWVSAHVDVYRETIAAFAARRHAAGSAAAGAAAAAAAWPTEARSR
jgi:hypothetical protein